MAPKADKSQFNPPSSFSFDAKDWPQWKTRFVHFHLLSKLKAEDEEYQVHALLYAMGERSDEILASFTLTDDEKKKYALVLKAFDDHFIGERNVVYERAMFGLREQREGETIEEFVTALHTMSEYCDYAALKEDLVRDRLILGVRDKELSKKLMLDKKLTLKRAVEIARLSEQINKEQTELLGGNVDSTYKGSKSKKRKNFNISKSSNSTSNSTGNNQQDKSQPQKGSKEKKPCGCCGNHGHSAKEKEKCPAKGVECHKCQKTGHFAKVCRSLKEVKEVQCVFAVRKENLSSRRRRWTAKVKVNGTLTDFKLDTGSDATCIPFNLYKRHFSQIALNKTNVTLLTASDGSLEVIGTFESRIEAKSRVVFETVYVVKGLARSLLGLAACEDLQLVNRIEAINQTTVKTAVKPTTEFPKLFEGLGYIEQPYHIKLKQEAEPYAIQVPRRIPLPLMAKLKIQLAEMVEQGVIKAVDEPTDWCAPMVIAGKPNGKIRICVDLSRLNQNVERKLHPMPVVEQELAQLNGATIFSKVDANSGFWQIPLTEESRALTTFITPFGRFCFNRLPFGISSAPEHYQKRMSQILRGLEGVLCHMDDILVFASSVKEHDQRLRRVLQRLLKSGITLNKEKCIFGVNNIRFLGHRISEKGIQADDCKIKAILEMEPPQNVTELRSFLGLANYLGRFVPHLADITKPLNDLRSEKNSFIWEQPQQQAFSKVKKILASDRVLATYDVNRATILSSDASSYGLGAVLKQKHEESWRPVAYASRTLTKTEQGYAQIEKEALGITWACERFRDYIIGKEIQIETDHKPLVPIFSTKDLNDLTPRLQRLRMRMMHFLFKIFDTPGKDLIVADAFSRRPLHGQLKEDEELQNAVEVHVNEVLTCISTVNTKLMAIGNAQKEDKTLQEVVSYTMHGWQDKKNLSQETRKYYDVRDEIAEENGILMRGERLIIPIKMRKEMLDKIHERHQGISKCRLRARESVWWPGISEEIASLVKSCEKCVEQQDVRHQPLIPSTLPNRPWQKVAMDLFQHEMSHYLVVVDYFSRYLEVAQLKSLNSSSIVQHCKAIFARHGIPEIVVSDNGPQFNPASSSPFRKFAEEYGFRHQTSSPKYPQSNGMAEAAVKIVKTFLRKGADAVKAIMEYRATPLANGYSPSELLMGRKIRTLLPCGENKLEPKLVESKILMEKEDALKAKQKYYFDRHYGVREKSDFAEGEKVWIKDMRKWGRIVGKANTPRSYLVETSSGTLRRNAYHLCSSFKFMDDKNQLEIPEPVPSDQDAGGNELQGPSPGRSRYGRRCHKVNRLNL